MEFVELSEKEFSAFADNHEYGSFHQNTAWGELKSGTGWETYLLGVKDKGKVIAASLVLSKSTPIRKNMFYAPRGFLIDYKDKDLLKFLLYKLKEFAKEHNAIFIKFDPYVEYQQRDINGEVVKGGFENKHVVDNLVELGCKHHGFTTMMEDMQPRWIFTLDTKDKTEEDIMKGMDPKTRQILRKNERMGVKVRELSSDELDIFHSVMEDTSSRREFANRPKSYYQKMYDAFKKKDEVMVLAAEFNHDDYIKELKNDLVKERKYISELRENSKENTNKEKLEKKIKVSEDNIKRFEKNIKDMEISKKENGNLITLGSILFMKTNDEILSLVGGSYEKYMKFQSAYTTHYAGVKYAFEHNKRRYNFYGITGNFNEKENPFYGLYSFKRDFGGQVVELVGEFDLIISPFWFKVYNLAFKLYHKIKRQ
jgi:peptidoglycan pentaglycine glycine transferase (the second and third glycine)